MGRMTRRPFAFFILILLVASGPRAFAQAPVPGEPAPGEPAPQLAAEALAERPDLFRATLPLDIAVADYQALGLWLRSLGLSEEGDATARRARLYAHYRVEPYASAASPRRIVRSSPSTATIRSRRI